MRKKYFIFICLLLITGSFVGLIIYIEGQIARVSYDTPCAFCQKHVIDRQKFYEDDLVVAMINYKPYAEGHCLIIPKRHVMRFEELNDREIVRIAHVIRKVDRAVSQAYGTTAYSLAQKNGKESGASVPHVHFHYIPYRSGNTAILSRYIGLYFNILKPSMTEDVQREHVERIREVWDNITEF